MSSIDSLDQMRSDGYKRIQLIRLDLIKLIGEDSTDDVIIYVGSLPYNREAAIIINEIITASIMNDREYLNNIVKLGEDIRLELQAIESNIRYNQSNKVALLLTRLYNIR